MSGAAERQASGSAVGPDAPGTVRRGLALLVAGGLFMEILDGTVIAPAAPHIAASLGVPPVAVNVAVTAYVLTLAVLIPISGWLTDRFGARRIFMTAVVVFTLASVGLRRRGEPADADRPRVLQGVGGAMMVPVGRLVVLRTTAKSDLIKAIAYLTWPALVAPVIAPALGGFLSTYASWRWIFLINVPLGHRRAGPGQPARPGRPGARAQRGWTGAGSLLTAVGVAALVVGIESIGSGRPRLSRSPRSASASPSGMLTAAVVYLLRTPRPLLDLRDPADRDVPGDRVRRLGLPGGDQRDPVPAAALLPARLRLDRRPGRPGRHRPVRSATSPSSPSRRR